MLQHFLRPNKLFDSFIMKLLHVSQLVRITCAAARHKNCGGEGFSKFRLAWRRADFFPAAAARQGAGWRRNSAAEGSTMTAAEQQKLSCFLVNHCTAK